MCSNAIEINDLKQILDVIERLKTSEQVFSILFPNELIELYIAGKVGCLLCGPSIKPTMNFDFVAIDYPLKYLGTLNTLENLT